MKGRKKAAQTGETPRSGRLRTAYSVAWGPRCGSSPSPAFQPARGRVHLARRARRNTREDRSVVRRVPRVESRAAGIAREGMSFWNKLQEATSPQSGADEPLAPTPTKPSNEERRPMAMLKRDELTSAPVNTGDLNALLGRGSEFEGKLTFEGTVRIDGKFKRHDRHERRPRGRRGREGGGRDQLRDGDRPRRDQRQREGEDRRRAAPPARMKGNIETPSLMIEKGVRSRGSARWRAWSAAPP